MFLAEIRRKIFHSLGVVFPLAYIFVSKGKLLWVLGILTVIAWSVEFLRSKNYRFNQFIMGHLGWAYREGEKSKFAVIVYTLPGLFINVLVFKKDIAILSILFWAVGDGLAALVGKRWGKIKIGKKSLEGTLACFATCFVLAMLGGYSLPLSLLAGFLVSLAELVSLPPDDNFSLHLAGGIILTLLSKII